MLNSLGGFQENPLCQRSSADKQVWEPQMNNQYCTSTLTNQQEKGSSGVHELNIKEQVKKHFPVFTNACSCIYTDSSAYICLCLQELSGT